MFNKNMVARMFGVGLIFSIACSCDISPIGFSSQANASGPDPENKIGHAKVRFSKLNYHGKNTDCKIVKEILSNPGYVAFWEESNQNPCN